MPVAYELNQRPPAERGPGPFEGPASYPQLCWWSLIAPITVQNTIRPYFGRENQSYYERGAKAVEMTDPIMKKVRVDNFETASTACRGEVKSILKFG
jgi:hypothetical protein